jgi:phosphate transport system protein
MEIRKDFHSKLKEIQNEILAMGSMVEKAIDRSVEALKKRDLKLAEQVIADDSQINEKRYDIEDRCVRIIATQQPMAIDLRTIVAVLNIVTELERIGDHAEGIAKITIMEDGEPPIKPLIDIPRMAEKTREMLHDSLGAFINRDAEAARIIVAEDDEVDKLYDQVFRELITYAAADPKSMARVIHLVWVAHNLERGADRVTNICERVVFTVTGQMEEIDASRY